MLCDVELGQTSPGSFPALVSRVLGIGLIVPPCTSIYDVLMLEILWYRKLLRSLSSYASGTMVLTFCHVRPSGGVFVDRTIVYWYLTSCILLFRVCRSSPGVGALMMVAVQQSSDDGDCVFVVSTVFLVLHP
jgi:hypothetical protein